MHLCKAYSTIIALHNYTHLSQGFLFLLEMTKKLNYNCCHKICSFHNMLFKFEQYLQVKTTVLLTSVFEIWNTGNWSQKATIWKEYLFSTFKYLNISSFSVSVLQQFINLNVLLKFAHTYFPLKSNDFMLWTSVSN